MGQAPTCVSGPGLLMVVRRCPTLPHPPGCSTIGAVGLSFRVRNGTGRFPHAMTAVTLLPVPRTGCGVGRLCGYNCGVVIQLVGSGNTPVAGLLFGNHIVDASSDRVCVV